ncbi:MAG: hypothetical protein N6V49_01360 [Serratia symbiotica]|nr:hypothetical protein [Serratia symbiotica]
MPHPRSGKLYHCRVVALPPATIDAQGRAAIRPGCNKEIIFCMVHPFIG